MIKYLLQTQTYILLTILFYVTSCNGQVKTGLLKDNGRESQTVTKEQPKLVRTQGTKQSDNVRSGLQDKGGNLWFGTTGEGVYRYDGKLFTQFTVKDGLNNNTVWSVLENKTGLIWFGTAEGICRYDGKTMTTIPITINNRINLYPAAGDTNSR